MNEIKQSAWSKEEDVLLADTVLQYIRDGKTQLAAFNDVAKQLSRTPGACGFRWNATLRQQYDQDIQWAKQLRMKSNKSMNPLQLPHPITNISDQIHKAISLLESLSGSRKFLNNKDTRDTYVRQLQEENKLLKKKLLRYEEAWQEIQKIGMWVYNEDQ